MHSDHPEIASGLVIVVSGPGGAGKGTIVKRLLELDDGLWLSRSWTTRSRRPSEDDAAYNFVSKEEFQELLQEDGFLEWAQFLEDLYGTPMPNPPAGMDTILEIDVQGALQVRQGNPAALVILVRPPGPQEQRRRLLGRGDDLAQVQRRIDKADSEEEIGKKMANLIVVNDELERAVQEVYAFIQASRDDATR